MVTKTVVLNQPNTALLSLILTISTFVLAYVLKDFRNKKFLGRTVSARSEGFVEVCHADSDSV